jgi:hypothetical protein
MPHPFQSLGVSNWLLISPNNAQTANRHTTLGFFSSSLDVSRRYSFQQLTTMLPYRAVVANGRVMRIRCSETEADPYGCCRAAHVMGR